MQIKTVFSVLAVALTAVTPALADGFYYGVGIGYTDAESVPNAITSNTSGASFGTLGATAGYRWDSAETFYGAEANLNLGFGAEFNDNVTGEACATGADGPYYCSHKATLRLRGLLGTDIGNDIELFGSLGIAAMVGDGAVSGSEQDRGVNTGVTAGIGLQKQAGANTHRIELVYDNLTNSATNPTQDLNVYSPDYEAVSLNYTLIFGR